MQAKILEAAEQREENIETIKMKMLGLSWYETEMLLTATLKDWEKPGLKDRFPIFRLLQILLKRLSASDSDEFEANIWKSDQVFLFWLFNGLSLIQPKHR